jgi:HK97 family phage portal protein
MVAYMKNYFTRFLSRFRQKSIAITGSTLFTGFDNYQDSQNLSTYKDSLHLYIGVSMIARAVAGVPLNLMRIKNSKGDVDEVLSHPIIELLAAPNAFQTQREFIELSVAYYILSGDTFWYIERRANGKPIGLHNMRPDYVEVVLSNDRKSIVAYEYRDVQAIKLRPEDVLHFRNSDPTNPIRGVGIVRPASQRILTEKEASKYQANFFKNQGRPDVAVFMDQIVTPEGAQEARQNWMSIFGRGNGGQVGFFGNNVKDLKTLNQNPKEMDFIETQKFLRDDILTALHIPEAIFSSKDANRANMETAETVFMKHAVVPVVEVIVDVLNHKFLSIEDPAVFFDYESPVPADREMQLKEVQAGYGRWLTRNEARELYNYEAVEDGDAFPEPMSFTPITNETKRKARQVLKARPVQYLKLKAAEDVLNALNVSPIAPRKMNSIFSTKEMKQSFAKAYNDRVDNQAGAYADVLNTFHKGQSDRLLERNKDGWSVETFMDVSEEKRLAKATFQPVAQKLYTEGGKATMDGLAQPQKAQKSAEDFFADPALLRAIDDRVELFANSVTDTTYEVLKKTIREGVKNGDSIDVIGRKIREYFTDMEVKRAKTIARTETGFILSKATNDAYLQSNIVTGKEWITVGDEKVRDEHVENDGVIVPKGGAFPNGEEYPAHRSINCRCVLAPAV